MTQEFEEIKNKVTVSRDLTELVRRRAEQTRFNEQFCKPIEKSNFEKDSQLLNMNVVPIFNELCESGLVKWFDKPIIETTPIYRKKCLLKKMSDENRKFVRWKTEKIADYIPAHIETGVEKTRIDFDEISIPFSAIQFDANYMGLLDFINFFEVRIGITGGNYYLAEGDYRHHQYTKIEDGKLAETITNSILKPTNYSNTNRANWWRNSLQRELEFKIMSSR